MSDDLWVMVMAGGAGTRFWPASREHRPKQLLPILGDRPLLRRTVDRVLDLVGPERILVVAGQSHGREVRRVLADLPPENVILEPMGRNTAAACGLAAWWLKQKAGHGVMAVLPADHLIEPTETFHQDLEAAALAARDGGRLVTLGLVPTRAETGYGYLEQGDYLGEFHGRKAYELLSFKEKPDKATAKAYLAQGGYFWNAGIFIWEADSILERTAELLPDLARGLKELAPALLTENQEEALARIYPGLPAVSVDFGIMEKAKGKCMIPAGFSWSDVGSWAEIHHLSDKDESGNAAEGRVLCQDSENCLIKAGHRQVVLLGVKDLVVVETEDALLIMDKAKAQEVGLVLNALREKGGKDLL